MSLVLRPVARHDLETVARIHAQCFPDDAWDVAALESVLAMAGAQSLLAEEGRDVIGLLFATVVREEAEILTFGVVPRWQRRGVARALLSGFYAHARALGASRVVLEVAADNAAALALYEAEEFRTVGLRHAYYQRGGGAAVDAWLLRRALG